MQPTSVCAVSYFNATPFIEGMARVLPESAYQLITRIPSQCAECFATGEADVALVPVGSLPDFKTPALLPDYCIGAGNKVDSVFLFANVPVSEMETVYLDGHSRTSNGLTRILMRYFWQKNVEFITDVDFTQGVFPSNHAGVIIGDRAFALKDRFRFAYDLAAEWHKWTGLPFTFAVWAYRPEKVSPAFLAELTAAFRWGVENRLLVAQTHAARFSMTAEKAAYYLTRSIDYFFDEPKKEALAYYLRLLNKIEEKDFVPTRIS